MKKPREADVLKACMQLLDLLKIPFLRNNTGAIPLGEGKERRYVRFGTKGSSDLIACLPPLGRMLCIECKSETGRLKPEQRAWLELMAKAGALCVVVTSDKDLEGFLREEGYLL